MRVMTGVMVAGLVGALSTSARAQEVGSLHPAEEPKRITVSLGLDTATAYLFRGIFQEDTGIIVPPFLDVGVSLYRGAGVVKSVTANGGVWNSLHSGPTGSGRDGRGAWYEADYYGSVTVALGHWRPGALYTSYTSPNHGFKTVYEIAGVVAYDDSASPFPLNPKATVAFELKGQADGGGGLEPGGKGTYLELGVRPTVTLAGHGPYPLTFAIPARLGLGLEDYYEGPAGSNGFGFFDLGGMASVPLAFMNGRNTWEVHGGVDVLWLGANNRILNGGDRIKPIGAVGISVTY